MWYLEALIQNHDSLVQLLLEAHVSADIEYEYLVEHTTFVMMRDSRRLCWCSCGLSYSAVSITGLAESTCHLIPSCVVFDVFMEQNADV